MIESNSTYRGWFVGGNQSGDFAASFAEKRAAGRGALGEFFAHGHQLSKPEAHVLEDGRHAHRQPGCSAAIPRLPFQPGWGGRYVRAWTRPT
jgi:hypothetical protein